MALIGPRMNSDIASRYRRAQKVVHDGISVVVGGKNLKDNIQVPVILEQFFRES